MWGRQSYRWSDSISKRMPKMGSPLIGQSATKNSPPGIDHVESFAGISGALEGLPQLPDGKFLPPMDLNCVEKEYAAGSKKNMNTGA